jgi:hypothetical protein
MEKKIEREVWVVVKGAKNYMVSNMGRVMAKAKDRHVIFKGNPVVRHYKAKILIQQKDSQGYVHYRLTMDDGSIKLFKGHRLVTAAFLGKCPDGFVVDHKVPGNKTDNRLSNLRYVTHSENSKNRFDGKGNNIEDYIYETKSGRYKCYYWTELKLTYLGTRDSITECQALITWAEGRSDEIGLHKINILAKEMGKVDRIARAKERKLIKQLNENKEI